MEEKYLLWLNIALDADSELTKKLLLKFDTPEGVYNAEEREYYDKIRDIPTEVVDRLCDKSFDEVEKCLAFCKRYGVRIVCKGTEKYPERLSLISEPPLVLYEMGADIDIDDNACVAVVGTRRCTEYGRRTARKIAYELSMYGCIVVSGIALGIDAAAHLAALEASCPTIAVLGCGLATAYPSENRELHKRILSANGMLITEYPPYSRPEKYHFPQRNRIISGMCVGAVIVESHIRSGALITAKQAQRQGKFVYAVPGRIDDFNSSGNLELIKRGAKQITNGMDVAEDFELMYPNRVNTSHRVNAPPPVDIERDVIEQKEKKSEPKPESFKKDSHSVTGYSDLTGAGKAIVDMLSEGRKTTDELVHGGIALDEVLTNLTILEIQGIITAEAGGYYILL